MVQRKQVAGIGGILLEATAFDLPPVTNTTSETLIHTFTLPGQTLFAPGQHIEIVQKWTVSTGTSSKILRIRHVTGGNAQIQAVNVSGGTQSSAFPNRRLTYLSASQMRTTGAGGTVPDAGAGLTTIVDQPIDWSIDNVFSILVQNAALADSSTLREVFVRIFQ